MNIPISPSELIITPRNTIYHLDIAPENMAHTIITVGDPERVKEVSKHFDYIEFRAQHREFVTHTGRVGQKRISVVGTGIGPDNIDIVFNELDALVNIDFATRQIKEQQTALNIIRFGTCGALQEDVPLDSVVASTHGIGLDNLLHYYNLNNNEREAALLHRFCSHIGVGTGHKVQPYLVEGSAHLLACFANRALTGITVTCPGFYGPQGRVLRLPVSLPGLVDDLTAFEHEGHRITNFEMETSAMYGLARLMGHQSLSVSAVVANRVNRTFSSNGAAAVEKMIRLALEVVVEQIATAL